MRIKNENDQSSIHLDISLTEMFLMSRFFNIELDGGTGTEFLLSSKSLTCEGYHDAQIIFELGCEDEDREKTLKFIKNLNQVPNFGQVVGNEYWICPSDVGLLVNH